MDWIVELLVDHCWLPGGLFYFGAMLSTAPRYNSTMDWPTCQVKSREQYL